MVSMSWRETLIELLNTTPVVDGRQTELLDDRWLDAHGGDGVALARARRVRDDLQAVVRGEAAAEVLERHLRGARRTPHVAGDGVEWRTDADWAAHLVLAWGELQDELPGRLRPCGNDECRLFLVDRSRAGTARWCSMTRCGNRMKARRHYDRTRG